MTIAFDDFQWHGTHHVVDQAPRTPPLRLVRYWRQRREHPSFGAVGGSSLARLVRGVAWSAVANDKRQRQDALRAQKLAEAKVIEGKQRARATQKKVAYVIGTLVVLLAIFALLTRGNSDSGADTTAAAPTTTSTTAAPTTTVALSLPAAIATKPTVSVPAGPPPKTLQKKDLIVGTGPEVTVGANVTVNYVGVSWSTKEEFDASWGRAPFTVENVGQAAVIPGWNEGLVGMKQGGRRQLVIPPDKAYGDAGQGAKIGPKETLVFIVDAIAVTPKA